MSKNTKSNRSKKRKNNRIKKIILLNGPGSKPFFNKTRIVRKGKNNKTKKMVVSKVDYAKNCRNLKSHEFMRELYSKNLSNRVSKKFKKGIMKDKFFLKSQRKHK